MWQVWAPPGLAPPAATLAQRGLGTARSGGSVSGKRVREACPCLGPCRCTQLPELGDGDDDGRRELAFAAVGGRGTLFLFKAPVGP